MKDKIIWMPHPGHFLASAFCKFRLNTYVNGYIISTVGEYTDDPTEVFEGDERMKNLGWDIEGDPIFYETMVFKAVSIDRGCCPYKAHVENDVSTSRYKSSEEAFKGHYEIIEKYKGIDKEEHTFTEEETKRPKA